MIGEMARVFAEISGHAAFKAHAGGAIGRPRGD
jgi:hypothetical protein